MMFFPKPGICLSPSRISTAVNQGTASCVESWYKRTSSLKCLSHPHPIPNKMMRKPGGETTAIWSVNQTHVCFTLHFQREESINLPEKKKKLTFQRIAAKSPKISTTNLIGSFGVWMNRNEERSAWWQLALTHVLTVPGEPQLQPHPVPKSLQSLHLL